MLSILWNLTAFMIALGILISVHEFGHFYAARYFGVIVKRFSIGFGKILWKGSNRHGTEFVVALIPLGGYIKMLDEDIESIPPETINCTLNSKTTIQKAIIILAGPIANFIFAIFSYWIVFVIGIPGIRPIVGEVIPNSIAANAQITHGMEIKAIDNIKTPDWDSVRLQLGAKVGSNKVKFSIAAPFGSDKWQDKILDLRYYFFKPHQEDPIIALGILPFTRYIEPVVMQVQKNSAASRAGLKIGDRIIKVNGQILTQWTMFVNLVRNNPGNSLILDIERQGDLLSLVLIPDNNLDSRKIEGFAGIIPKITSVPDKYKTLYQYGPFNAIVKAINKTWQVAVVMIRILEKLIIGDIDLNSLSGPISVAHGAGVSAELGIVYYLMFLALISMNLGIVNLLPLYILDGGRLLFLVIEYLKGSPVSGWVQDVSYQMSLIILTVFVWFVLVNDFSLLIR